jgi:hypothetical protein
MPDPNQPNNPGAPKLILGDDWKKKDEPAPAATPQAPAAGNAGISVDADWKNQAAAERERLAAAEQQKATKGGGGGAAGREQLPEADFQTLLSTMVSQALMYMGAFPDPQTGRAIVSLEYARFHIDLLHVLAEKTKGNLTQQEEKDVQEILAELQGRFVEIAQAVAQAVKEGKIGRGGAGAMGMGPAGGSPGAGIVNPASSQPGMNLKFTP